jgi:hypothetical protein
MQLSDSGLVQARGSYSLMKYSVTTLLSHMYHLTVGLTQSLSPPAQHVTHLERLDLCLSKEGGHIAHS